MYTKRQVARAIDHAVLKATTTVEDVRRNAAMCVAEGVGNLCVRPCDVAEAAAALRGTACALSAAIGFPLGANRPEVKALEARLAIADGAVELDMVMNVGRFLSGEADSVRRDIAAVVAEARPRNVLVKVILEVCYLSPAQIAEACGIAEAAGADFVKTSTGFAEGTATPEAVAVMLRAVGGRLGVKASGGIRTWDQAVGYLRQGCRRLGLSGTEAVLAMARSDDGY